MHIKSEKGFALALALTLTIVLMIATVGMYSTTEYAAIESKVKKEEYSRGYYAAIAGLRYASILLSDPTSYFSTPEHNGEVHTVTGDELDDGLGVPENFFQDINADPSKFTITITEWNTDVTEWNNGEYKVEATYTY